MAAALDSALDQGVRVEIFVGDGGSADGSVDILRQYAPRLAGWRSHPDAGQSAAINECIAQGTAPYVCWLNSDDLMAPGGLVRLLGALQDAPDAPAAYGRAQNLDEYTGRRTDVWVEPFSPQRLAQRCIIAQPATVIRRTAWEAIGGVDESLHMAMDYDLWWRLYRRFGPLRYVDAVAGINRMHNETKTRRNRRLHYREAMRIVRQHYGSVPLKWWLAQPYAVWFKALVR